jgi:hypothetical protein
MSRPAPARGLARYTLFHRLLALRDWLRGRHRIQSRRTLLGVEPMEDRVVLNNSVWLAPGLQAIPQGGSGTILVDRSGDTSQPLTVNLGIGQDGEGDPLAVWNTDYTLTGPAGGGSGGSSSSLSATGGTVTFGAYLTEIQLQVAALPNASLLGAEGFRLTVQSGSGYVAGSGASGGTDTTADVRITGALPSVWLDPGYQAVPRGTQGAGLWVYRDGGDTAQPLTVSLGFGQDGEGDPLAVWNTDYTLTGPSGSGGSSASLSAGGGTVTFGADETAVFLADAALADVNASGIDGVRITVLPDAAYQVGHDSGSGGSGSGGSGGSQLTGTAADIRVTVPLPLSVVADSETIVAGDDATFSISSDTGMMPTFSSVEWDFDYDGQTFQPAASGTATDATTVFAAAGSRTVAVRLTDDIGDVMILTLNVTVTEPVDQTPTLSIAPDTNAPVTGESITFQVLSDSGIPPTFPLVEWDFDYDGQTFEPDVSGSDLGATTSFATAGDRAVAARLTDDLGNSQLITLDVTVGQGDAPVPALSIAANAAPIVAGEDVTFSLCSDTGSLPSFASVEWDFDYDWDTFQPAGGAADVTATTAIDDSGPRTVAVRLTDSVGSTQILTLDVDVADSPPPAPTPEWWLETENYAITTGDPVIFDLVTDADPVPEYTSVEWDFNYDGQSFNPSINGTNPTATTTYTSSGDRTIAVRLTTADGTTQFLTTDISVEDPVSGTGALWLDGDTDQAVRDEPTEFWVGTDATQLPAGTTVQWDLNYDGTTFVPDSNAGTDWTTTATFDTNGDRTIAAELTDADGNTQILTMAVSVSDPPPTLTVPADMTVNAGYPVQLLASASADSGIASVEWQMSYDGEDYQTIPDLTTINPTYTFPTYGQYDLWVLVTANDGQVSEDGFHVTADEDTPDDTVTGSGPIDAGSAEVFTTTLIDPDSLDSLSVLADWTGEMTFEEVAPDEMTVNGDGSVSFSHVYDGLTQAQRTFPAVIRIEDDGGQYTDHTVNVTVSDVKPTATLTAGTQIAFKDTSGQDVWAIQPGQAMAFDNVQVPSEYDASGLTYHFQITDTLTGRMKDLALTESSVSLPNYTGGRIYTVTAWVTDRANQSSDVQTVTVVVDDPSGYDPEGPRGGFPVTGGIYGSLFISGGPQSSATPPPDYNRFGYEPTIVKTNYPVNQSFTALYQLDEASLAFAQQRGYTIRYNVTTEIYDVEQFSIWSDNHDLLSQTNVQQSGNTIQLAGQPADRETVVLVQPVFLTAGGQVAVMGDFERIIVDTPKTPTVIQQFQDLYQGLRSLLQQFGSAADDIFDAVTSDPVAFVGNLVNGLQGAVGQFINELPSTLERGLNGWLLNNVDAGLEVFRNLDLSNVNAATTTSFLLQYAGLTWDHVYQVALQTLGAGNVAALEKVVDWFGGANPLDPLDPASMTRFVNNIGQSADQLRSQIEAKIRLIVETQLPGALAQAAAKFTPGVGWITSLVNGLGWLLGNSQQLPGLATAFLDSFQSLAGAGGAAAFQSKLVAALNGRGVPMVMGLMASQFGLARLPQQILQAVSSVPATVDTAIRSAVSRIASAVGSNGIAGGTAGGLFDGKLAPERTFAYQDQNYVLWTAQADGTRPNPKSGLTRVKIAVQANGSYKLVGDLTTASFLDSVTPGSDGQSARTHMAALASAAQSLYQAVQAAKNQPADKATMPNLRKLQEAVTRAENLVLKDILANACVALGAGCFAAGTKLLTRSGWKVVEEIGPGEEVLSRHESDPAGATAWKLVEERFERTGCILHLHVGGEVIRTTPEHPFYIEGKGWTAAGGLHEGDRLATLSGEWVAVEEVFDTQTWEPVYNLRVADHHTYFVGTDEWGFAVWAHNDYLPGANAAYAQEAYGYVRRALYWRNNYVPQDELGGVTVAASRLNGVEIVVLYGTVGPAGGRYISQATVDAFEAAVRASGGRFYHAYRSFHAEEILYEMAPQVTAIGVTNRPCGACRAYFLDTQHFANVWWPPIP